MIEYNFYQDIDGTWIKLNLFPIPEPRYEITPEEFGDGTHKVGVEPVVNGQGLGIQYELEFILDFELNQTVNLEASSSAIIEAGDTLLIAYHYNSQLTNFDAYNQKEELLRKFLAASGSTANEVIEGIPSNFAAEVLNSTSIKYTWDEDLNFDGYDIYLDKGSGFEKSNSELLNSNEFIASELPSGVIRAYLVFVLGSANSMPSNVATSLLGDILKPSYYYRDFSEYPTVSNFLFYLAWNDWARFWNPSNWTILEVSGSTGGKVLRNPSATNTRRDISNWFLGFVKNAKFKTKVRSSSTVNNQLRLHLRAKGSGSGNEKLISLELFTESFRSFSYQTTGGDQSEEFLWLPNTWYTIKGEINDKTVKGKVWESSEPEPLSNLIDNTYDTVFEDYGFVGFGSFTGTGQRDFDFLEVSDIEYAIPEETQTIQTIQTGGNNQSGNTFILETGVHPIRIDSMKFSLRTGEGKISIFYKEGDMVYNPLLFNLVHQSEDIVGNDNGNADQEVIFNSGLILKPDTKYSFFVSWDDGVNDIRMNYTNGFEVVAWAGLKYTSDRGLSGVDMGSTFNDRRWNGEINYKIL